MTAVEMDAVDLEAIGVRTVIRWEDPAPRKPRKVEGLPQTNWTVVRLQLRARPGEWALVAEGVNSGMSAQFKQKGFEAATRNHRESGDVLVCDLYARYIGGAK